MSRSEDLERIAEALDAAVKALAALSGARQVERKSERAGDYVTDADHAVNDVLKRLLPRDGEGWLSEETADDAQRLACKRVWIVDPLDGTQEFVQGLPEWCISIGLVENGRAVAGGICNPATSETFLGSLEGGITLNGRAVRPRSRRTLEGAEVLASRSEVRRGEWEEAAPYAVRPMGSVAYKMARVAAGLTDATWTLSPKHEWDVAGGAALVLAGGGTVRTLSWEPPAFNLRNPWLSGLVAIGSELEDAVKLHLADRLTTESRATA
jgi:myo-inositol-1(or 4)-monophosphatase